MLFANGPGVIEGSVFDSVAGSPISRATITFQSTTMDASPLSVVTAADGTFRAEGLSFGNYFVTASASGFLLQSFGAQRNDEPGNPLSITAASQHFAGVIFRLVPTNTISGRLLYENRPIPLAKVYVLKVEVVQGASTLVVIGTAHANSAGEYSVSRLDDGKYYVATDATVDNQFAEQTTKMSTKALSQLSFFPDSLDPENAIPVVISGGVQQSQIDIDLHSQHHYSVTGHLTNIPDDSGKLSVELIPILNNDVEVPFLRTVVNPDLLGAFHIDAAEGIYEIQCLEETRRAGVGEQHVIARQKVLVDHAVTNFSLVPFSPAAVATTFAVTDSSNRPDFSTAFVSLIPRAGASVRSVITGTSNAEGVTAFAAVDPGEYEIRIGGIPDTLYVRSVVVDNRDVKGSAITIREGTTAQITILLAVGRGQIRGSLRSKDQRSKALAVLISDELPIANERVHLAQVEDGKFTFSNVAPGHYYAFAAEVLAPFLWESQQIFEAIKNNSVEVDIDVAGHAEIVLDPLSLSELQGPLERIGVYQ